MRNIISCFIAFAVFSCTPAFAGPVSLVTLMSDRTTTGAATAQPLGGAYRTYFALGSTTAGSGACAVKVQVSNNNTDWIDLATITLTLGTTVVADGLATTAPWKHVRANVASISGTNAKCSLIAGGI